MIAMQGALDGHTEENVEETPPICCKIARKAAKFVEIISEPQIKKGRYSCFFVFFCFVFFFFFQKKRDNKSLWIENHEMNNFFTYRSYYMSDRCNCTSKWFLAIKNNGRIKNGNNTLSGMNSAQFQFVDTT